MCVGIPGKVIRINGRMATVEVGGASREIALDLIDGVEPGDYVIAHAGFAIHRLDESEALRTLDILKEISESLGAGPGRAGS
jgi:hydrogenase expression/formation protein HypC